jgi:hypothetical protein
MREDPSFLWEHRLAISLLLLAAAVLARLPYFNESLWYDEDSLTGVLLHDVHPLPFIRS